jgi:uncharacterized delta-60 repeat protein
MIPLLLARGLAPSTAIASSLLTPAAMGAPGDLDTTFADVGRMTDLDLPGAAWSLEALHDDEVLFAGGDACDGFYCGYYYYDYAYNFVSRLSGDGSTDPSFTATRLENVEIFDVAMQPDGKAIAVGRTVENARDLSSLTILRLERDGALDLTFGEDGIVRSTTAGLRDTAGAVALDPDGRIVVAGSQGSRLIVMRLLANGAVDASFGSSGSFLGPANQLLQRIHILRTSAGAYRITANSFDSCRIVGLTTGGAPDASFGDSGVKLVGGPPATMRCKSMAAQTDGRVLIAGRTRTGAFVTRLLASGEADPSFVPTVIPDLMTDATALTVAPDDSLLIAGRGPSGVSGAVIVRLQADGELDVLFGNAGATWIDLPFDADSRPDIHDVAVLPDGGVVAVGGYFGSLPFVVRLVDDAGADGPGVVGVKHADLSAGEGSQEAIVTVRRMGGDGGRISVAYRTVPKEWEPATGGLDYTEVSGRLTWEDGDASEREIAVPIVQDTDSESSEWFVVALEDVQGGAGMGTRTTSVEIVDDEPPAVPQLPVSPSPGAAARQGGGALGLLSLMLFGVARALRFPSRLRGPRWTPRGSPP